jgi:hypothetical protein
MKIRQMVVALAGVAALVGCGMGMEDDQNPQNPQINAVPPEQAADRTGEDGVGIGGVESNGDTHSLPEYGRSGTYDSSPEDWVHVRQFGPQTLDGKAAKSDGSKQCFCGFCQRTHAPSCL